MSEIEPSAAAFASANRNKSVIAIYDLNSSSHYIPVIRMFFTSGLLRMCMKDGVRREVVVAFNTSTVVVGGFS